MQNSTRLNLLLRQFVTRYEIYENDKQYGLVICMQLYYVERQCEWGGGGGGGGACGEYVNI